MDEVLRGNLGRRMRSVQVEVFGSVMEETEGTVDGTDDERAFDWRMA